MHLRLPLLRCIALVALAGSLISLIDAGRDATLLCGFESGCAEVTGSSYGRIGPIPLPVLGVLFFLTFYLATLFPFSERAIGPMALLAGVAGITLLGIQVFLLRRFCRICLIVDAAAMLLAVVELAIPSRPIWSRPRLRPWLLALAAALAVPVALAFLRPSPEVPEAVKARRVAGKVNVFLITNFQCRHCRSLHEILDRVLAEQGERVSFWMEPLPLPNQEFARAAGRLFWCARKSGKGEAMARSLFQSSELSQARLAELAKQGGANEKAFRACLDDETLDRDIDDATAWLDRRSFRGLPILWIEDQVFAGQVDEATLRAALDEAFRAARHK